MTGRATALSLALGLIACGNDGTDPPEMKQYEFGFCEPNPQSFPLRPAPAMAPTLPWLQVNGTQIVTVPGGEPVALRGFNFGSWLMLEVWISGIGLKDEGELIDELFEQATALGVDGLLEAARAATLLDWAAETRAHWVLVKQWRSDTYANASAEQKARLDELWAWFDAEPWIFEERSLWKWLAKRFGRDRAEALRTVYYDHYITELDVQRIADLGLNLIRVPVWYEALETDSVGDNGYKLENWQRLHELAGWARKHGVYLMLDLHGAPGGQSTSWHQGLEDGGVLWQHPECIDKTVRLWKALASYFADDPHIAVLDLLNEPMSAPDASYRDVHDQIYQAIREVDDRHIVMIEDAYRSPQRLTSPREMGWDNAMFSIHLYPGGGSANDYLERIDRDIQSWADEYSRWDVPLFLGEFNSADGTDSELWAAEGMDLVLARLNQRGIHWAPWTWKYHAPDSQWGLYVPDADSPQKIDVRDASFEQIKGDFTALDSSGYVAHAEYTAVLRTLASDPAVPLDLGPL